jgi:hypothetical protein
MSNDYTPGGGGIDPAMLTQLLQYLIMQGGQGGQLNNLMPQGSLDSLSFGYQPTGAAAAMPMIPGTANNRQVGSIEEAGKQANYFQDVADIGGFGDISGALFGLGGYSSDAFAPEVTRELIPRPATQQFNQWLQSAQQGDLSFEGLIASEMQSRGISPRQAVSEMREILQNAEADAKSENPSQALQDQAAQIRLWLPNSNMTNGLSGELMTGDAAIDWQQAFSDAEDAFAPYMQEQQTQPGPIGEVRDAQGNLISSGGEIIVGSDGQLYRQTTTDSPLAQQFHEAGIPLPTEQYTPGDLLGAGWQQADAAFQDTLPQITDQLAQYQADIDRANSRAESWSQLPLQEFYDRGSVPGIGGGGTIAGWPTAPTGSTPGGPYDESQTITTAPPIAPVADTNTGIVTDANNPWPGMDPTMIAAQEAQRIRLEQERIAREENPQLGGDWWSMALNQVTGGNRPAGAPSASTPVTTGNGGGGGGGGSIATQIPYTVDPVTGQPVLDSGVGNAGTGIGGGGAGGQGAPRTIEDLGQPGADEEDYRAYRARVEPYETPLTYERWLAQQNNGWDLATSPGAYLAGMRPHPDQYAVQSGRMRADQANPQPPSMEAILAGATTPGTPGPTHDDYVRYRTGLEPYETPLTYDQWTRQQPAGTPSRTNAAQVALLQQLLQRPQQQATGGGAQGGQGTQPAQSSEIPPGGYEHNGAIFDAQDRLIGYTERARISNFENQRDAQFSGGRRGFLEQLWPDAARKRTAASGRTNAGGQLNAGAQAVLRYGLDTQTSPGHSRQPSGKDRMSRPSTGFNRRDLAVLGFRNDARNAGIRRAQLQDQQTLADRAIHGAAYARARGYTDALRQLGITPTSVALANRTGGINAMFGR